MYRYNKIDYSHPFKSTVFDKKNLLEVGILDKQNGYNNIFNYNNDIKYVLIIEKYLGWLRGCKLLSETSI